MDGSKKHQPLSSKGVQLPQLSLPEMPLIGWEITNYSEMAKKIPHVTHGKFLYGYVNHLFVYSYM